MHWLDRAFWPSARPGLRFLLLGDLDEVDGEAYFRLVWSEHIAEARDFEGYTGFAPDQLLPTRYVLLADLERFLVGRRIDPHHDVRSVLDIGCSKGFLLRFVEQHVFEGAVRLVGVDLDARAIADGAAYLAREGSKIELLCGDMARLDGILADRHFDIVFCTGALMYLTAPSAQEVVRWMLDYGELVVLTDIAHPNVDNGLLPHSERRDDRGYLHNLDGMVRAAGGSVLCRRWEGDRQIGGFTIYFVFAGRAEATERVATSDPQTGPNGRQTE